MEYQSYFDTGVCWLRSPYVSNDDIYPDESDSVYVVEFNNVIDVVGREINGILPAMQIKIN